MYELAEFVSKNIKDKELRDNLQDFINNISESDIEDYVTNYSANTLKFNNEGLEMYTDDELNLMQNDGSVFGFFKKSKKSISPKLNPIVCYLVPFQRSQ